MKLGLDFGTTNSSLSRLEQNKVTLLPIDQAAPKPEVIRTALYFYPKELVISKSATPAQIQAQTFNADQISYEGETRTLIGSKAIKTYLNDNKFRKPGVLRQIYTGKTHEIISWVNPYSGRIYKENVPEVLEEMDYGTGRLFHALKTALKSSYYKGTRVFGSFYTLEDLIGVFITDIKQNAEKILGEKIEELVVGRPVYFSTDPKKDFAAQKRLEDGLKAAGIKNISFEYEPVAAAKYFVHEKPEIKGKILIFDFGGGTLDTTIVDWKDRKFNILVTDGVYIGGDLLNSDIFTNKLGRYFGSKVKLDNGRFTMPRDIEIALESWFSLSNLNNVNDMETLQRVKRQGDDPEAIERLIYLIKANLSFEIYEAIETAKKKLSTDSEAFITYKDGIINFNEKITRKEFEDIITPNIEEVRETVVRTLERANLKPDEITAVVATGGSSLLPIARKMLTDIFGDEKVHFFDLFTSIAAGLVL